MLPSRLRSSWTAIASFTRLLRANAATARSLNDELVAEHGITIEQYELLARIAHAPTTGVRQSELRDPPLVTAANVERVLGELAQKRLVDRSTVDGERVVALTGEGRETIRVVRSSHSAPLEELFGP